MTEKENQPQKTVVLYNGEPRMCVRLGYDGVYRWATQKTGTMSTRSKKFLREFMENYKYEYYVKRVSRVEEG